MPLVPSYAVYAKKTASRATRKTRKFFRNAPHPCTRFFTPSFIHHVPLPPAGAPPSAPLLPLCCRRTLRAVKTTTTKCNYNFKYGKRLSSTFNNDATQADG